VHPPRAGGSAHRLQDQQRLSEIGDADTLALHGKGDGEGCGSPVRLMNVSAAELAAPHRDETLGLQDPECLTERRPADAILAEQVLLSRKLPITQLSPENPLSEVGRN